jgi:hypothetical protein
MSEVVRVILKEVSEGINWPQRCPQCGTLESLIEMKGRVFRQSGSYQIIAFVFQQQTIDFHIPICSKHSFTNELGMRILQRSLVMSILRGITYLSLLFILSFVSAKLFWHISLSEFSYLFRWKDISMMIFFLYGVTGLLVILWARKAASVCPIKIYDDADIISLRFTDEKYAKDFKRANSRATRRSNTDKPIFFLHPWFWKTLLSIFVFIFIFYKFK